MSSDISDTETFTLNNEMSNNFNNRFIHNRMVATVIKNIEEDNKKIEKNLKGVVFFNIIFIIILILLAFNI